MFGASCVLLCAVGLSQQAVFTYTNPWDPFRRSNTECEMCYHGNCFITNEARCEFYAESSKVLWDDEEEKHTGEDTERMDNKGEEGTSGKIDSMVYELVDTATSTSMFKICVPFISQYTDCTEENICTGCKFCTCSEEGRWICSVRQQCRPGPKVNVDHRVIDIVVDSLSRKRKSNNRRDKRSTINKDTSEEKKGRLTYKDISEWLYETPPLNLQEKTIDTMQILEPLNDNLTVDYGNKDTGTVYTTDTPIHKNDIDVLEFNEILKSWTIDDMSTNKPMEDIDGTKIYLQLNKESEDILAEFDPIRLVKRDTSQLEANQTQLNKEINSTRSIFAHVPIIKDALYGLSKIIDEKERELEGLLHIQESLLEIAKSHNTSFDVNDTNIQDNYNNHEIAIYKIDPSEKCLAKLKHDMYNAIENIIKTEILRNSTTLSTDLKVLLKIIKKYIFHKHHNNSDTDILTSQENEQDFRRHVQPDRNYEIFDPISYLGNVLTEINIVSTKPLDTLSQHVRKILKRVIIQLYFDDFAVIDIIVHETHYNFMNYLENIGIKWNKMIQDIIDSETTDKLYRTKLLHLTLRTDISKIEDMISVLEFAKNRRMTVTNGEAIEKSIMKIKNNLKLIDSKVQEIIKIQNVKRMRKMKSIERTEPIKKLSMMQKLKKIFQNSRDDIKNMLRKKIPKSQIMKEIAKKKMGELEKQRMLEYQKTMKQWQQRLNVAPGRRKRSAWGFQNFVDRIKSIIPGYLKKKVNPAINSRKKKTRNARKNDRKMKHNTISSTVRTSHKDRIHQNKSLNG